MSPVLLCPPGTDRDDWLAARQAGIGASEIAAVLGISPWDSPFSLFWKKTNGWGAEDNGSMEAGRRLEHAIADWARDRLDPNENLLFHNAGLYASGARPWQLATPDRLVYLSCCDDDGAAEDTYCATCEGIGYGQLVAVLEVKHPGSWDGFGEDETDEIPVHYRAQVLWQMDVMEAREGWLAAYCNHQLRTYHLQLDDRAEEDLKVMREAAEIFWAAVQAGEAPDLDSHAATLATLKRLHPSVEDRDERVVDELAEEYRAARAAKAEAEARVDAAEARLRAAIGTARRAVTADGQRVATRVVTEMPARTQTVAAHTRDYLLAPRPKKAS